MAEYNIGSSGAGFDDTIRRAQQGAQKIEDLNRAEERRRQTVEKTAGTEEANTSVRSDLASATERLSVGIRDNTTLLGLETGAIAANTAALKANLDLRRQMEGTPLISQATQVSYGAAARTAPIAAEAAARPVVAADTQRLQSARTALASAEIAATAARSDVTRARGRTGTTPEALEPLIGVRETANQQLAAARRNLRAAQASADLEEQINAAKAIELAEVAKVNEALAAQRIAAAEATAVTAVRVEQAGAAVSGRAPLLLGPGTPAEGPTSAVRSQVPRVFELPGGPGWHGVTTGGPAERVALPEDAAAAEQLQSYRERATANASALSTLTARQRETNAAFQEAGAVYADASTRLTRHGALTSEFIGALARGQVTLGEFGEQMVATIGKFGGWAVAGAAVYGVVGAFHDLLKGAADTQNAVSGLSRFLPGLGGPQGGGRGQIAPTVSTIQDISTQFNVPIKEVGDAMQVTSRVFHNLSDSADATRAILAASKLDQISVGPATQYILGISQSLGYRGAGQGNQQAAPLNIISSLNALQDVFGARVQQTLPGVARAAPVATATGLDVPALEVLTAMGVRGGLTGNVVGTALTRSLTNFAFSPGSQLTYRGFGLNPQIGEGGALFRQIIDLIDVRAREGRPLSGTNIRDLSVATGGPQLSRVFANIFEQEALAPGTFQAGLRGRQGRSFQADLDAVLSSVSERFHSLGIALQNFGSQLYEAGAFGPISGFLGALTIAAHVVTQLTAPFAEVLHLFNELPSALQTVLGTVVAYRATTGLLARRYGAGIPEDSLLGRLPGFQGQRNIPREQVTDVAGRLQTYLLPQQQREVEQASLRNLRAQQELRDATNGLAVYQANNRGLATRPRGDPEGEQYQAGLASRQARIDALAARAETTEADFTTQSSRLAEIEAQLVLLKDDNLSWAQRAAFAEQQGMVASEQMVTLKEQIISAYRAQLGVLEGGVAGVAAAAGAPAEAGGLAAAAGGLVAGGAVAGAAAGAETASAVDKAVEGALTGVGGTALAGATEEATLRASEKARAQARATAARTSIVTPTGETVGGARAPAVPIFSPVPERPLTAGELATPAGRYLEGTRTSSALARRAFEERFPVGTPSRGETVENYGLARGQLALVPGPGPATGELRGSRYAAPELVAEQNTIMRTMTDRLVGLRDGLVGFGRTLVGPGAPIAGLLGSQLIGSAIGGGTGAYISSVGGGAASGALIAQMLAPRFGAAGVLGGAAAGSFLTNAGQGHALGSGAGAIIGGGIGLALGSLTDWFTGPTGTLGGLAIGSSIGGWVQQNIFGGGGEKTPQDVSAEAARKAREVMTTGSLKEQLEFFGADTTGLLSDATFGTGDTQQRAQAGLQARVSGLAAQQLLYGPRGSQGRGIGTQQLSRFITGAVIGGIQSPALALQSLQAAQQPFVQNIGQQFSADLARSTTGGETIRAASHAQQAYQAQIGSGYDAAVEEGQKSLDNANNLLAQAQRKAAQSTSKDAQHAVAIYQKYAADAKSNLTALKNAHAYAKQAQQASDEAQAAQALQQAEAQNASTAGLAAARSGGNSLAALQETHKGYQANLRDIARDPNLSPQQRIAAVNETNTALTQNWNQQVQEQGRRTAANIDLAAARQIAAAPGNPIVAARATLTAAEGRLADMKAHARAYDIADIVGMQQQVVQDQASFRQTVADQAVQLTNLSGQLTAARDYGDTLAGATAIAAAAHRAVGEARGPVARQTATLAAQQADNAVLDARRQRIQEQGALAQAQHPNDTVAQAQALRELAQKEVASARGYDQQVQAQTDLTNANNQYNDAIYNRIQAEGQLAASEHPGDTVAQAAAIRSAAARALGAARGPDQTLAARTSYNQANEQVHQAIVARIQAQGQLAAAQRPGDTVAQAAAIRSAAARALAAAHGVDQTIAAQTAYSQANEQLHQAIVGRIQAQGQLAASEHPGDSVAQAQAVRSAAARMLAAAHGIDQMIAAQTAYKQSNDQLNQAIVNRDLSIGDLAASTTPEPLKQLDDKIAAARKALADSVGVDARRTQRTNLNSLLLQRATTAADQRASTVDFEFQMMQITAGQAAAMLTQLAHNKNLSQAQRDQYLEQARRYQLGLESPIGGTGFDLAPGNPRLPTFYDVSRAITGGGSGPTHNNTVDASATMSIVVNVGRNADVGLVADAIDRTTGAGLSQRLRAAGVR